jgi:hypothetical protein
MKRIIILTSMLLCGILMRAQDAYTITSDDVIISSDGAITRCNFDKDKIRAIIIPEKIDEIIVKSIGNNAFKNYIGSSETKYGLTEVYLPSTLESIGTEAFYENSITVLDLSKCTKLRSIGKNAFRYSRIKAVDFSNCVSLETIGSYCFGDNRFRSISFSNCHKLTSIGTGAFRNTSLSGWNLPECDEDKFVYQWSDGTNTYYEGERVSNKDNGYTATKTEAAYYNVTFNSGEGGGVEGDLNQRVKEHKDASAITAVPQKLYIFKEWRDVDGNIIGSENPLIFTKVTKSMTITAIFETFMVDNVMTIYPEKDAFIYRKSGKSDIAKTNYGANPFLSLYDSKSGDFRQVLISFSRIKDRFSSLEISDIENSIESVTLNLYHYPGNTTGHEGINLFKTFWYTEEWAESNVTWNNAASLPSGSKFVTVASSTSKNQDYSIDVTDVFKNQYSTTEGIAGFRLVLYYSYDWNNQVCTFASREYEDSNYHPCLKIIMKDDDTSTGINELADSEELSIYPNPTDGEVNITLKNGVQSACLSVYSLTGKKVYSDPAFVGGKVDLSGLSKGIYFVKVSFDGKISIAKLIRK